MSMCICVFVKRAKQGKGKKRDLQQACTPDFIFTLTHKSEYSIESEVCELY